MTKLFLKQIVSAILIITFMATQALGQEQLSIDTRITPFSYRGSYMCFTQFNGRANAPGTLTLLQISRRSSRIDYFKVEAIKDGKVVETTISATPEQLTLKHPDGQINICYESANIIRFQAKGIGLRLSIADDFFFLPITKDQFRYMSAKNSQRFVLTRLQGKTTLNKIEKKDKKHKAVYGKLQYDLVPEGNRSAEMVIEEYLTEWPPKTYDKAFEDCVSERRAEFGQWVAQRPKSPKEYDSTTQLAMYVNWSCLVKPRGWIKREGMLMSKTWMNGIWSWDHCFNAIATAPVDPQLAWDQLMVVFDNQMSNGVLPDGTFENDLGLGHVKPPIHGWTIRQMMQIEGAVSTEMLREVYPKLVQWTYFWFNFRDDNRDGILQYNHGNDSGWDNGTVFDVGCPVEAPDLCAFMIIQLDVLAEIAELLSRQDEAQYWTQRADELQKLMIDKLWNGEKFLHRHTTTGVSVQNSISSLSYMPIILGERLPKDIKNKLIEGLKRDLITDHGIATESPKSKLYLADGYWRGPIWPSQMHLLIDGIDRAGEPELAKELAIKFCNMCKKNQFAENFDAQTGEGLRDPAYTWASSVYLAFIRKYTTQ